MRSFLHIFCAVIILCSIMIVVISDSDTLYILITPAFLCGWLIIDNLLYYINNRFLHPDKVFDHRLYMYHEQIERRLISMLSHYVELEKENENLRCRLKDLSRVHMRKCRSSSF